MGTFYGEIIKKTNLTDRQKLVKMYVIDRHSHDGMPYDTPIYVMAKEMGISERIMKKEINALIEMGEFHKLLFTGGDL